MSTLARCPDPTKLTPFEKACIRSWKANRHCQATEKCCKHSCGATCQHAAGLDVAPGLSAVPVNVTASERGVHNRVRVQWHMPGGIDEQDESLVFVLQERNRFGHILCEERSRWRFLYKSKRTNCLLPRKLIKPGRRYRFRVAAVNSNGTRGFSEPSDRFKLSIAPRPPSKVQNLTPGQLERRPDGTLRCLLTWDRPADADLPIARYEIYCSREFHPGCSTRTHRGVTFDGFTEYLLHCLDPGKEYFVQVHAVSLHGHKKLESERASMFLNTTIPVPLGA